MPPIVLQYIRSVTSYCYYILFRYNKDICGTPSLLTLSKPLLWLKKRPARVFGGTAKSERRSCAHAIDKHDRHVRVS